MSDAEGKNPRKPHRRVLWIALAAICLCVLLVLGANLWVSSVARDHLFDDAAAAPDAHAALVLGCSA